VILENLYFALKSFLALLNVFKLFLKPKFYKVQSPALLNSTKSVFNSTYNEVIEPQKLDELEEKIVIILCQLEMFFPLSFFDIVAHLVVYLVREIKLCGSIYI